MTSRAFTGYGSKLQYSADGVNFLNVVQLQRISPAGSKQKLIDQTNLRTPDSFTRPFPVQIDSGDIEITGVYSADGSQFALAGYHGSMSLLFFRLTLTDGTVYTFSACVSEFKPWDVTYNKYIPFSAKLSVSGGITGPLSTF